MEIPKLLYHYTSLESGLKILKSAKFRLYDVLLQSDTYEVIYTGNNVFNHFTNILQNETDKYSAEFIRSLIYFTLFIAQYYGDNEKKTIVKESLEKVNQANSFLEFQKILNNRVIKFLIACFSDTYKNKYLWENYASHGSGIVITLKSDNLPKSIGIKQVHYLQSDIDEYMVGAMATYYKMTQNDPREFAKQLTLSFTDLCLSIKRELFKQEKEYRLIASYDSEIDGIRTYLQNDGNRDFVILPLNKSQFYKRIKSIYITDKVPTSNLNELKNFAEKKEISIKKIKYQEILEQEVEFG